MHNYRFTIEPRVRKAMASSFDWYCAWLDTGMCDWRWALKLYSELYLKEV